MDRLLSSRDPTQSSAIVATDLCFWSGKQQRPSSGVVSQFCSCPIEMVCVSDIPCDPVNICRSVWQQVGFLSSENGFVHELLLVALAD
jgi:hypothetical protein